MQTPLTWIALPGSAHGIHTKHVSLEAALPADDELYVLYSDSICRDGSIHHNHNIASLDPCKVHSESERSSCKGRASNGDHIISTLICRNVFRGSEDLTFTDGRHPFSQPQLALRF
jgi:hypothetical protein